MPGADRANQLAQVKRLVRMAIEYGQQSAARFAEQVTTDWRARLLRTHNGYDCTLFWGYVEAKNRA